MRLNPLQFFGTGLVALVFAGTVFVYSDIIADKDAEIATLKKQAAEVADEMGVLSRRMGKTTESAKALANDLEDGMKTSKRLADTTIRILELRIIKMEADHQREILRLTSER
jgi:hypothetical protein